MGCIIVSQIKLVILDVDGTLTDGKIYYDNNGNESKAFNVKDGLAISTFIKNNINVAIITGRDSMIVARRASELGIRDLYQGVDNKLEIVKLIIDKHKLLLDEVIYIGDDLNDLEVMRYLPCTGCPADASNEIRRICSIVATRSGGDGAVREILEEILKINNLSLIQIYSNDINQ